MHNAFYIQFDILASIISHTVYIATMHEFHVTSVFNILLMLLYKIVYQNNTVSTLHIKISTHNNYIVIIIYYTYNNVIYTYIRIYIYRNIYLICILYIYMYVGISIYYVFDYVYTIITYPATWSSVASYSMTRQTSST